MHLVPDFDLSPHNTLGLSSSARFGVEVFTADDAREAVQQSRQEELPLRVLGGGSNVILHRRFDGLLGLMRIEGIERVRRGDGGWSVSAGAGVNWHALVKWTLQNDMPGLENLAGIPGTVGAAPIQNIGAYGVELADRFETLVALDTHTLSLTRFSHDDCTFSYRDSLFKREPGRFIIVEVTLALPSAWQPVTSYAGLEALGNAPAQEIMQTVVALRTSKLPDWKVIGNVGSFFHNPIVPSDVAKRLREDHPALPVFDLPDGRAKLSAGWLIDRCGLKGKRIGGAGVSEGHALVVVNHGDAREEDIAALADYIRGTVAERYGVNLTQEPEWF